MSTYSGIIFFDSESRKFNFVAKESEAIVSKILELDWTQELRLKKAKVTIDGKVCRGNLFTRIIKNSASKSNIADFLKDLKSEFGSLLKSCKGDYEKAYKAFVVLKETDTKIPELSADIPADLFPEDDELELDKAKKEKSKTISSAGVKVTKNEKTQKKDTSVRAADGRKSGNFVTITELNAVLAQVKERALAELRQNQERIRMEIVKKINQICQQQREQQYTHQESSNSSVSATKSSRAIADSKLLPFNSNEDIDAFFERGSYEDEDALYNLLKTYFSELSQVVKGIKRLLSDEYRAGHLWKVAGTSVSSANPRPEMNATMREWIESMFIRPVAWENPHMAEQIKKKIQRSFTDTHAKRKMDNTENANVKTESVDYVERAISEGGANFEEANVKKIRYDATSDRIMEEDGEENENDPIAESEDDEGDSQQNEQNINSIENNEPTMPEVTDEAGIHI